MDSFNYFSSFSKFIDPNGRMNLPLATEFMRSCANRQDMARLLEDTAQRMEQWPSDTSYDHNNGFLKISILRTQFIHARLHVWHKPETSTIHNHGWDFISCGIEGEIEFRNFEESGEGLSCNRTILQELRDPTHNKLLEKKSHDMGRTHLLLTSIYSLLPFGLHAIDYRTPHQSKLITPGAVSLIVTGPSVENESSIFEDSPIPRENKYSPIGQKEKALMVSNIASNLLSPKTP